MPPLICCLPYRRLTQITQRLFDPWLPNVSALLHGGVPPSPLVDDAGNAVTNSNVLIGQAAQDGAKYAYFNGSAYAAVDNADTGLSLPGDFTVELWVNPDASITSTTNVPLVAQWWQSDTIEEGFLLTLNSCKPSFYFGAYSNGGPLLTSSATLVTGVWSHVAITRSGTTFTMWVNGAQVAVANITAAGRVSARAISLGNYYNDAGKMGARGAVYFKGYMNYVRITQAARYSAGFVAQATPDFSSSDPLWASTSAALTFTPNLVDAKAGRTITNSGLVVFPSSPVNGSVFYFPGNAYATIPSTPKTAYPAGVDFTVELWFNLTVLPSASGMSLMDNNVNAGGFNIVVASASVQLGRSWIGTDHSFAATWTTNRWYHLAVVRRGTTISVYRDGTLLGSASNNISYSQGIVTVGIGGNYSSLPYTGFMSDFRITKGKARYTAAFTPPAKRFADYRDHDYFADHVVLQMNMNDLVDAAGHPVSVVGTAVIDATKSKYGTGSLKPGAAGNYVSVANDPDWDFSASDVTIEAWVNLPAGFGFSSIVGQSTATADGNWFVYVYADGRVGVGRAGVNEIMSAAGVFKADQWNHVAVVKSGSTTTVYYNGVSVASGTAVVFNTSANPMCLGAPSVLNVSASMQGNIDDLRITKGIARYTANFSVPIGEYESVTQTGDPNWRLVTLLLNGETITDRLGASVTTSGGLTTGVGKYGSALVFDGVDDYATVPYSTAKYDWWTSDHTIEMWTYVDQHRADINGAPLQVGNGSPTANSNYWSFGTNAAGHIYFYYLNGAEAVRLEGTTALPTGQWAHLALTKRGSTIRIFVNGVQEGSATVGGPVTSAAYPLVLGGFGGSRFKGRIDDLRITKGLARYTANFTVPQAAFKTYADGPTTDLLWSYNKFMSGMDVFPFVDEMGHTVVNNNGVTLSSAGRAGAGAAYFNGTSGFTVAETAGEFSVGAEDFTVEFWINPKALTTTGSCAVSKRINGSSYGLFIGTFGGQRNLSFCLSSTGSSWDIAQALSFGTWTTDAWHHVALVRNGTKITGYLNGVAGGSVTVGAATAVYGNAGPLCIGAEVGPAYGFTGYIDEVRFAKGVARYRGNFRPPVYALPKTIQS